jgi:hypothetical protein
LYHRMSLSPNLGPSLLLEQQKVHSAKCPNYYLYSAPVICLAVSLDVELHIQSSTFVVFNNKI